MWKYILNNPKRRNPAPSDIEISFHCLKLKYMIKYKIKHRKLLSYSDEVWTLSMPFVLMPLVKT